MRAQLLHLSGALRGTTRTYTDRALIVGTAADSAVRFPEGIGVGERHCAIQWVAEGCAYHLQALDGQVFVNRKEVREVILENCDLLEFGVGGPTARFRVYPEAGAVCKPVRVMLKDARDVGKSSGVGAFAATMTRDLLTQSTRRLKIGFVVAVLAFALPLAWLAGWLGGRGGTRDLAELRAAVGRMEQRFEDTVSRDEIAGLRRSFEKRAAAVDRMVAEDAALRRVYEEFTRSVCLIHGRYGFRRQQGDVEEWLETADGQRAFVEYVGSGFLASAEGHVVTNRHVAAPWLRNEEQRPLLDFGWQPRFLEFRAFFPGRQPVPIDRETVLLREDSIDVAVVRVEISGVPVLPLDTRDPRSLRGAKILVVGYPTGVNGLLAKADEAVAEAVTNGANSLSDVLEGLVRHRAITPLVTQGGLNEVRPTRLVYDAMTTRGGSGGPVFGPDGRVVGVNFAILRDFTGSNFGVPVQFARELLPADK